MMLKAEDLNVYYGPIHAVKGVSFEVHEGEIVTLIGANGAGKSTTLKTLSKGPPEQIQATPQGSEADLGSQETEDAELRGKGRRFQ